MANQRYKSVYFADHPSGESKRKNVKIAFGEDDLDLFDAVSGFTSAELRALLQSESLLDLSNRASTAGHSLNGFCLSTLRRSVVREQAQQLQLLKGTDLGRYCTAVTAKSAPVHRWFPWLEGYSEEFVHRVVEEFAPGSSRILDPFGGSGTTPLAAVASGRQGFYCEINPLLRVVTRAKALAGSLTQRRRHGLADHLRQRGDHLRRGLTAFKPDAGLAESYRAVFGDSKFFDDQTFEHVLRLRAYADTIAAEDPELGLLMVTAIAAALVPSALVKRAGDLRFRRPEETGEITDLIDETERRLTEIAEDLSAAGPTTGRSPVLLAADARDLSKLPSVSADLVVTSPPYLNGTNYFRNTKLELWFLRALKSSADLAAFRRAAVTAGINDVTGNKATSAHPSVRTLADRLAQVAYDKRIPRMISTYFADMEQVLGACSSQLVSGAKVVVDIGDSIYAGVRVPTDELLATIAQDLGFRLQDSRMMRTRVSRDGSALRQMLLVLEWPARARTAVRRQAAVPVGVRWEAFKASESHRLLPFAARNWGHPLHSLCSYQGKLKPSLAHHLVRAFLTPGDCVLDPFGGVGTIPLEAALHGVRAFSFDISPAAHLIASGKLLRHSAAGVENTLLALEAFLRRRSPDETDLTSARHVRFNGELSNYFHPDTLREVLLARQFLREGGFNSSGGSIVAASMLHILHGNRPYALSRRSHPITPFAPTGDAVYKSLIRSLRSKVRRALAEPLPEAFAPGEALVQDAAEEWPAAVDKLDAIITSPPFFDSTRFYLANWMRLWFAGWDISDFQVAPRRFIDERQKRGFGVYEPILRQARERLKPGAPLVIHVGRSRKCDMAAELVKVAAPWFAVHDRYTESVRACESHGIRDKGTVTEHEVLVFV